jgi:uncharacterized SAM-binding protein YcdF (DUF218 family)
MSRRRILAVLGAVGVIGSLLFAALSYVWFLEPTRDDPGTADVIYVLGGGGDRIPYTLDLVRGGVASHVVFSSTFVVEENVWAARPCNSVRPRRIPDDTVLECLEADPPTTRGEAQMLAELVEERGWDEVVVVASTDQVSRARRLFERCWDGDMRFVSVPHHQSALIRVAYEWGASIKATFLRGC